MQYLADFERKKMEKVQHYIRLQFECQNGTLNVKKRYLVPITISKEDFEHQNSIFFQFECQNRIKNVKSNIHQNSECQNMTLNVKKQYSIRYFNVKK